jgi:hypothetical protein
MWVLGLLWAAFIITTYGHVGDWSGWFPLALLVPICLIIFSLRDRKKPN